MKIFQALLTLSLVSLPAVAQTQLVRGEVDGIQNTANLFKLKCTTVRLTSATLNLQGLHDATRQNNMSLEMQVIDTFGNGTSLEVVSAVVVPRQLDMGNLRFGRAETWEIFAAPGSMIWSFVGAGNDTRYLPLGDAGTWILGPSAVPFVSGTASAIGSLRFNITMTTIPALTGAVFASQAIIQENGAFRISNPECKEVRSN